jgi:hypothetical protein
MNLRKRLFADITIALPIQTGPFVEVFRLRRFEPQRREDRCASLDAQARLFDRLAILLLRGFPLGAAKGFCHLDEIVAFGLRDEPGEREQFATLILREAREVRAIRFDRAKHPDARLQIVI